jgi:hypothetical protein
VRSPVYRTIAPHKSFLKRGPLENYGPEPTYVGTYRKFEEKKSEVGRQQDKVPALNKLAGVLENFTISSLSLACWKIF